MGYDLYVGASSNYKKIRPWYIGVGGAWKEVLAAYIGVGGNWKAFYGSVPYDIVHVYKDAADVPTGAGRIASYDGKFPRMTVVSADVGDSGGALTHNSASHGALSANSGTATNPLSFNYQTLGANGYTTATTTHYHSVGHTHSGDSGNTPAYEDFLAYRHHYFGKNAVFLFDGAVPAGWTEYTTRNLSYMRFNSTAGGTGGDSKHYHAYSGNSGAASSTAAANTSYLRSYYFYYHTHPITHTHSKVVYPPYSQLKYIYRNDVFTSLDALPSGVILFSTTATVPDGWSAYTAGSNRLVRHTSGASGGVGGDSSHSHGTDNFTTSTYNSGTSYEGNTGTDGRIIDRTDNHTFNHAHTTLVANLPKYIYLYAIKKD